ncbi:Arylsulfatase [hydrothermal vent metagenome]|uniref:Arylsulfatase n=1 Tax=hydrothermal vent metagenome TaxID=652676 RepID=A0A3B0U457_9ZZZZ
MKVKFFFSALFLILFVELSAKINKPNIILFFVDDLGYGDLSCFGNPNIRTPNIDMLANEGIRLTSFYAAGSVCTPSRAGLLTGRYPLYTLGRNVGLNSKKGLPLDEPIIPEVLRNSGYNCMAIGKWHLGHANNQFLPTSRGFNQFYGLLHSNDAMNPWVNTDKPLLLYKNDKAVKTVNYQQDSLTIDYTNEAIRFIKENQGQPFFLYLPYSMPHLPISTPADFRGKSAGGLYGDVVETIDWSVGEIMKVLGQLHLEYNTIVIFASDNGPWHNLPARMLQKGVKPWHQGTTGLLHGSKATTYEGGMRVPGIFYWKGIIPAGQVSSDIITTLDIFPTLIEIADAETPIGKKFDGYNILPFLTGNSNSPRSDFYYFNNRTLEAVRDKNWKLRFAKAYKITGGNTNLITPELFNMMDDPGENYNIAEEHPEIVKRLMEKMEKKAKQVNGQLYE